MKPCPNDPNFCECRVCFLYLTDERYRKIWNEPEPQDQSQKLILINRYKERANIACAYLGKQLEDTASCGCAGAVKHECKVHGECRRFGTDSSGIKICRDCDDFSANGLPVLTGINDPMPESYQYSGGEQSSWIQEDAAIHLEAFTRIVESSPIPPDNCSGDGIIYVGGGKYWPGIVIGIRLIRELGCHLPIEVWHRGNEEPVFPEDLQGIESVEFKDILTHGIPFRNMGGWEAKLFAIANSKFERVLFLDADAYCVKNPISFFQQQQKPFEFWEDLHANIHTVKWNAVWPTGSNGIPPIQGGQLLIDRKKAWKLIVVSHWMCQHSDWYFRHMFGDQDTWRVALAAMNDESLWRNLGQSPWRGIAFVLQDHAGDAFIVHRCQGKLFSSRHIPQGKTSYSSAKYGLPMESRVFQIFADACQRDESNIAEVFSAIYSNKIWGQGSGSGSSEWMAKQYAEIINREIQSRKVKSLVDLGSGDCSVISKIVCDKITAIDCVQMSGLVQRMDFYNQRNEIPEAEMYLMKDVIHHWSNRMVDNFIGWWKSNRNGILICTQDSRQNRSNFGPDDCPVGGYRALNWTMEPLAKHNPIKIGEFDQKDVLIFAPIN